MTYEEAIDILQKESNEEKDTSDLLNLGKVREWIREQQELKEKGIKLIENLEAEVIKYRLELGHKQISDCCGVELGAKNDGNGSGVVYFCSKCNKENCSWHWKENTTTLQNALDIQEKYDREITRLHLELGHKAICECGGEIKFLEEGHIECNNCVRTNTDGMGRFKIHWEEKNYQVILGEPDTKFLFNSLKDAREFLNDEQTASGVVGKVVELKEIAQG